jgi:predicted DNA-binding transcriptional regulator AlpA
MSAALMTQTELAQYLGKGRWKIAQWTKAGILPTFIDPESGRTMYPRASVDAWLASATSSHNDPGVS